MPHKDEQLCDFIQQLQKIKRDIEEVDMVSSLAQEIILISDKNMHTEKVSTKGFEFAADKKLPVEVDLEDINGPEHQELINVGTYGPIRGSGRSVKAAKNAAVEVALKKLVYLVDPS